MKTRSVCWNIVFNIHNRITQINLGIGSYKHRCVTLETISSKYTAIIMVLYKPRQKNHSHNQSRDTGCFSTHGLDIVKSNYKVNQIIPPKL